MVRTLDAPDSPPRTCPSFAAMLIDASGMSKPSIDQPRVLRQALRRASVVVSSALCPLRIAIWLGSLPMSVLHEARRG